MHKKDIGIIGLGKFGLAMGVTLTGLGHRVLGLDASEDKVQAADGRIGAVYRGNATNQDTLRQLRFQDLDCVVISVGQSMENSILITLNLQDLQVKHIIAKAVSQQHATVLTRLGVSQAVQPEREAAIQAAYKIDNPGMLDLLPAGGGMLLQEVTVDRWAGKDLRELALPAGKRVMVVAKKLPAHEEYSFVPDPKEPLEKGEVLLLIGKPEDILKLAP